MPNQLTPERLAEIRRLVEAVPPIEYQSYPSWDGHHNSIAEIGADGKYRNWDTNIALSDASCAFLAQGKQIVLDLLEYIEQSDENARGHEQQFADMRQALSDAGVDHIGLSVADAIRALMRERETLREIAFGK